MDFLKHLIARGGRAGQAQQLQTPSPILRWIKPGSSISVIDLGANKGDFTRAVSTRYRIARGVLVEPIPHLAERLRRQFPAPVYQVFESAISDRQGSADFEMNETEATSSLLKIKRDLPEHAGVALATSRMLQVVTRTLDDLVREAGLDHLDLLKIDVQGAEDKVLAGAVETLPRTSAIWIEVSFKSLYEGSVTYPEIYNILGADFRPVEMQPAFRAADGEIIQSDVLFMRRGIPKPS